MRFLWCLVPLACLLSGCRFWEQAADTQPAPGPASWHVTCESDEGQARHCAMDTSRGVQLERQLSQSPCIEGQGWGYDQRGVWVDKGCRAEFASATNEAREAGTVRCESADGRYRFCRADFVGGAVMLTQLSNTPCIEDRSWGWKPQGVWVNHGCRADFGSAADYADDDAGPGYRGPTRTVRCESDDGQPHRCDMAARGARLQRQISNTRCIQDETWGWDQGGVWVTAGCRGDFAVW